MKIPPYPTQRKIAGDLIRRRHKLLGDMIFMENSLLNRDFTCYRDLLVAKQELNEINERLSTASMKNYVKAIYK